MAYKEHLGGNKYRLVTRDPSAIGRKRISQTIEVPPEFAKSERKTKQWLDLELAKFVEKVESGELVRLETEKERRLADGNKHETEHLQGTEIHL